MVLPQLTRIIIKRLRPSENAAGIFLQIVLNACKTSVL